MAKTTLDDLKSNPGKFIDNTVVITANKEVHYSKDVTIAYNSAERSRSPIVAEETNVGNRDDVTYLIRNAKGE